MRALLRKTTNEKAPSEKELAGNNRLRAVVAPIKAQADNSPELVAQPPPLVKGLDASHELKLALDFTLSGCADELVRKHVASRKFIIRRGAAEREGVKRKMVKEPKSVRYQTTVHNEKGNTVVVYYETAVVTFNDEEIILNTGGWWTRSTQDRMNWASKQFDLAYKIQRQGKACVEVGASA